MNADTGLVRQFRSALRMLRNAIRTCPEDLWIDPDTTHPTWQVAYHVLSYTDLYLSSSEAAHCPWEHARPAAQFLGPTPWPPHERLDPGTPFSRDSLVEFVDHVDRTVASRIAAVPLEAPSGFDWIPFDRFELHLYNLRHLQHHTAQLIDRLRECGDVRVEWIGMLEE